MAAVLYQEHEGRKIIAYASSRFNAREQNYHINEQECLAVIWATRKYRPYLEDRRFQLRTDSKALTWLNSMKDQRSKLTRWALELQALNFDTEHCPGKLNELPDFLSRNPTGPEEDTPDDEHQLPPEATPCAQPLGVETLMDEVRDAQRRDPIAQRALTLRRELDDREPRSEVERTLQANFNHDNGLLFNTEGAHGRLVVPKDTRMRVLYEHHDVALAGHPSAEETLRTIEGTYFWSQMKKETEG